MKQEIKAEKGSAAKVSTKNEPRAHISRQYICVFP